MLGCIRDGGGGDGGGGGGDADMGHDHGGREGGGGPAASPKDNHVVMRFAVTQRADDFLLDADGAASGRSAYLVRFYGKEHHGVECCLEKCPSDKGPYTIHNDKVEIYKGLVTLYDDVDSDDDYDEPSGIIVETLKLLAVVKRCKYHLWKER